MTMSIKRNSRHAAMTSDTVVNIPGIKSRIGGDVGRETSKSHGGSFKKRTEIGHIMLVKRECVLAQDHIAKTRHDGCRHSRSISPKQFLFLVFLFPRCFARLAGWRLVSGGWLI